MEFLFSMAVRMKDKSVTVSALTTEPMLQDVFDNCDKQELGKDILAAVHKQMAKLKITEKIEPSRIIKV